LPGLLLNPALLIFCLMTGDLKVLLDRLFGITNNPLIPLTGKVALIFTHLGP